MRTKKYLGFWLFVTLAILVGGCSWAKGFTIVLPDREIEVTIPKTGVKVPKVNFDLSNRDLIRGSGELVTVKREVRDFDQISIMGSGEVSIIQGDRESLTVTIEDNLLMYLQTQVRAGTLTLGWDEDLARDKDLRPSLPIQFDMVVKELSTLSIYGSADIVCDELVSDRLTLEIFGAGDINMGTVEMDRMNIDLYGAGQIDIENLSLENLEVGIFGVGNVSLAGDAVDQEIKIPGRGDYRAEDLRSKFASVFIAGSGDATLWVTEHIEGTIDGSGHLRYYGNPDTSFSGSGSRDFRSLGER